MAEDDFDSFLSAALAPAKRDPDRVFVARVQARIALDSHLAKARRLALSLFAKQVIALVAVASAIVWLTRSASVAGFLAQSSGVGLLVLFAAFAFVIVLVSPAAARQARR